MFKIFNDKENRKFMDKAEIEHREDELADLQKEIDEVKAEIAKKDYT